MIRIRFAASWLRSLRGSARFVAPLVPLASWLRSLRYIGLVVIVNAVLSKLGVVT